MAPKVDRIIRRLARPDTFIGEYIKHLSTLETPLVYDFWTAVWLIGASCGRTVIIDRPQLPVRLNWFLILVGESGALRKSTAVSLARTLIEKGDSRVVTARCTPEKLEEILAEETRTKGHAYCSIAISELVRFVGREHYARHMPGLLTDLYDSPEQQIGGGTVTTRERTIRKVFVSFLSATTPTWLLRAVNQDVVEGGFTSRCIFIVANKRKRKVAWPDDTRQTTPDTLRSLLHSTVTEARRIERIQLSPGAIQAFTRWYNSRTGAEDAYTSSFEAREDEHVLRLAGCLAINDHLYAVQSTHIKDAIRIVAAARQDGRSLFAGGSIFLEEAVVVDKLRTALIDAGFVGLGQNEIVRRFRHLGTSEVLTTVLELMHELDMVQKFEVKPQTGGRAKTIWRGTKNIASDKTVQQLVRRLER